MEYFIIQQGKVWDSVLNILERKAKEGVEVRVMYDGLCSLTKLPVGYYKKLRQMGIKSKPLLLRDLFLQHSRITEIIERFLLLTVKLLLPVVLIWQMNI